MKNNGPVTQRETPFPHGKYLVSKTDLKGIITYANDAFVEISGFSREELIGKSHNCVRHPDMPPAAFEDLWKTIKSGRPWRGFVKNRCKNGDHYWVEAFVVPIKRNGQTVGYMSVRSEPSREDVRKAEALYQKMNAGQASMPRPKVPPFERLSLRLRLQGVMALMALLIVLIAGIGMYALTACNNALLAAYDEHMASSVSIAKMVERLGDDRAQIMLGLQHSPDNKYNAMHDHSVMLHIDATLANRQIIEELRAAYEKRTRSAEEQALADAFFAVRDAFSKEGVEPAREALKAGDYDAAQVLLLTKINPLYNRLLADARALQAYLTASGQKAYKDAEETYAMVRNLVIGIVLLAILIVIVVGNMLVRSIVAPMKRAIEHFDRISEGILTDEIDTSRTDETGYLLCSLAMMQVNLKVILDEVRAVSQTLDEESKRLNQDMNQVVAQSLQQQDRVQGTAAATEELTQSVAEVASSVDSTAQAAARAKQLVAESTRNMDSSMEATSRVVGAVQASSATIADLNRAIEKIGAITNTIREIAEQTNLLALNAAIEAARAGEQGRGFAVVADEVRKLAERTSASTADITATVAEIRRVTDAAVGSMDHAVKEVEQGIGRIRESMTELTRITGTSQEVTGMARHIAEAAREQAVASEQVANNMEKIASLIDSNLASAQEAKKSADTLNGTAHELRRVVGQFRVIG